MAKKLFFEIKKLNKIASAKNHSTLFNALNTILPMPNPKDKSTPGALNFNHASIKLMAQIKPIHKKTTAIAIGIFIAIVILLIYRDYFCNIQFYDKTFPPFFLHAILLHRPFRQ